MSQLIKISTYNYTFPAGVKQLNIGLTIRYGPIALWVPWSYHFVHYLDCIPGSFCVPEAQQKSCKSESTTFADNPSYCCLDVNVCWRAQSDCRKKRFSLLCVYPTFLHDSRVSALTQTLTQ